MSTHDCGSCSVHTELARMGVSLDRVDRVVALAGNPNTGKSTLFNALTGLRQHTGNWPGKTVTRAEGAFEFGKVRYKLVDLPGTYSLLSASHDEEVARDFLLFGQPDATIVVVDATSIERATRKQGRCLDSRLVHEIEENPLLRVSQAGKLAAGIADDRRRRGDVLRAGVHVAEQTLDRASAQRQRAGRRVHELRDLLTAPCDVRQGEPHQGVLPDVELSTSVERLVDVAPRLVHQRPRGSVRPFRSGVLFVESATARESA